MIYKDLTVGTADTEDFPAHRLDRCLNCHKLFENHIGWKCSNRSTNYTRFWNLLPEERFLTQKMLDSIVHNGNLSHEIPHNFRKPRQPALYNLATDIAINSALTDEFMPTPNLDAAFEMIKAQHPGEGDTSDWRTWAKVSPGNCSCNIPRHQCDYHREDS